MAEQEKREKVTDEDVEAARRKVEIDLTLETVGTLPQMHQIVLYAIGSIAASGSKYSRLEGVETGFLFSGEVYEEYEHTCKHLRKRTRSSRWYKEYLNDLEVLGLITTALSGKGVRGHTTLIRLGPSPKTIMPMLKKTLFG
jgi:cell division control protein 6